MSVIGNGQPALDPTQETKLLTFLNSTGVLPLFTVTGDVWVEVIAIGKTTLASAAAANMKLGIVTNDDCMIVDTVATLLEVDEFWNDKSPDHEVQVTDRRRRYDISNGNNIILTADAQIDSGAIVFYCFWGPLSADGLVVPA